MPVWIITAIAGLAIGGGAAFMWFYRERVLLQQWLSEARIRLSQLEQGSQAGQAQRVEAETRLRQTKESLEQAEQKVQNLLNEKEQATARRYEAEKQVELIRQRIQDMERRVQDWEKTKEESMSAAKTAMFETGTATFRKEAEEVLKNFEGVVKSVTTLSDRLSRNESVANTLWKALADPTAVGSFSEVGLENTLKNYGLQPGRDFVMQYAARGGEGESLRPDAVVFLPGGNLMVLDSKASRFFLDIAQAQNEQEEAALKEKLKKRMQAHLNGLASKGYKDAVRKTLQEAGRKDEINHIFTLLFLHSENHVEKIFKSDPELLLKAEQHDIVISGPTGLASTLSLAKFEINREHQHHNQIHIMEEVGKLLGGLETVLGHALKLGRGIESASRSYGQLAASINRSFLPKARTLQALGVSLPKNKPLPGKLPSYTMVSDETPLIEAEASGEEESQPVLEMAEE